MTQQPMLDVSFILNDPMFADTFDVYRRAEVVGTDGRVRSDPLLIPNVRGVVTQEDPSDLAITPDSQSVPRVIEINSSFKFREATQGFQPDRVKWNGAMYLVKKIYPYSRYGAGHSRVTLESTVALDPPQAV